MLAHFSPYHLTDLFKDILIVIYQNVKTLSFFFFYAGFCIYKVYEVGSSLTEVQDGRKGSSIMCAVELFPELLHIIPVSREHVFCFTSLQNETSVCLIRALQVS